MFKNVREKVSFLSAITISYCGLLTVLFTGCSESPWKPEGKFDAQEVIQDGMTGHVLLFETGRVTHFMPNGESVWMGQYRETNGIWIWDLYANHWRIEPQAGDLSLVELGDTNNPLLLHPTNRFRLKRIANPN